MRPCQWSCPHHSTIRLTFAGTGPIFNRMVESSELQNAALDDVFHALSDDTRRDALAMLAAGPVRVSDLAAPSGLSLPTVMKHLAVLEDAGLIVSAKDGRTRTCALVPQAMDPIEAWLDQQRATWEEQYGRW